MEIAPFTPRELFDRFDRGEIEREELHDLLAHCAEELIAEMEADYQNPAAGILETLLARRMTKRLLRIHQASLLREILVAISQLSDFPPARHLWNANHPDVPLHCFLRVRRQPIFRIKSLRSLSHQRFELICGYTTPHDPKVRSASLVLARDASWRLEVVSWQS